MSLEFRLIITLLLLAGVGFLVWEYTRAIETATTVQSELSKKNSEFNALQARYEEVDRVLKEKFDDDRRIQQQLAQFGRKLEALKLNDKAARDWAAEPIPASVRDVLRSENPDGVHADAAGTDGRNPVPGTATSGRREQRGAAPAQ